MAIDVAVSGINGRPLQFAGITCSALPLGPMARHPETYWVPQHIHVSGMAQKYDTRFDDPQYYG